MWTLIIGTPFYLSNWRMRYSRMTWRLLILAKYLGIILKNKIQNSMFLEWYANTYQCHIWSFMTKPSTYASYFVLSLVKLCDPCWEIFHAPKIKTHVHATNKQLFLHWEYAKTCSPSLANKYSMLLNYDLPSILRDKKTMKRYWK